MIGKMKEIKLFKKFYLLQNMKNYLFTVRKEFFAEIFYSYVNQAILRISQKKIRLRIYFSKNSTSHYSNSLKYNS